MTGRRGRTSRRRCAAEPRRARRRESQPARIPNYQRPYSWKKEHALQLLDDLGEALDRGTDEPYFLGSIVLIKDDDQLADVIDGQQRLTTLTILFAVLRDMATDDAVKLALDKLLSEPGDVLRGLEASPRLLPRERDAEFFASYVHKPGGTNELVELNDNHVNRDSVRNVRDNASALRNELVKRWDVDNRLALVKFLSTNASMVAVSTPDRDSAYRIFRVMNARGCTFRLGSLLAKSIRHYRPALENVDRHRASKLPGDSDGSFALVTDVVDGTQEEERGRPEVAFGAVANEQQDLAPVRALLHESSTHIRVEGGTVGRLPMEFGTRDRVVAVHRGRTELACVFVEIDEKCSGSIVPSDPTRLAACLALDVGESDRRKDLLAPVLRVGEEWHGVVLALHGSGHVVNTLRQTHRGSA